MHAAATVASDCYAEVTTPAAFAAYRDRAAMLCPAPTYLFTIYPRTLDAGPRLLDGKAALMPLCR